MKKIGFFVFILISGFGFSQTQEEIIKVENTNDIKVIASFLKAYPKFSRNAAYKSKLARLLNTDNSTTVSKSAAEKAAEERRIAVATSKPVTTTTTRAKHENTAKVLSHLFDSDPNKKEAYVRIKNKSKCPITVTFSGRTAVNVSVPANGENHILVPKGNTRIFSMICGGQYQKTKNISGDYEMVLGSR